MAYDERGFGNRKIANKNDFKFCVYLMMESLFKIYDRRSTHMKLECAVYTYV